MKTNITVTVTFDISERERRAIAVHSGTASPTGVATRQEVGAWLKNHATADLEVAVAELGDLEDAVFAKEAIRRSSSSNPK